MVRQHQEGVFRLAYLLLGDPDEAADVAQDTFIRAYRKLDRFDTQRPLRPWLLRIASNLARNRQRANGRYKSALQRAARESPARVASPHQIVARREASQILWEAMHHLDTTQQEIIYLRFFLALPVKETAQALDIAEGTVKSRLSRALDRLREVIEEEYPELAAELE